ncbi:MAG: hypothetical protein J6A16_07475 [Oscillospiraceae bacterium]|nr:hypothetical protein [Oscillospiraceae bacterium]
MVNDDMDHLGTFTDYIMHPSAAKRTSAGGQKGKKMKPHLLNGNAVFHFICSTTDVQKNTLLKMTVCDFLTLT